jgi:hypothetical protein
MRYKVFRRGNDYELALGIQSDRVGHHLRFIARGSGFGNPDPEVKWQASLATDELAALHGFLGGVLSQREGPQTNFAPSAEGFAGPTTSIEDFLFAWWNWSGGARGTAHGWQMGAKKKGLEEFLTVYQRAHQRLPRGLFEFSFISLSTRQTVTETVDADAIHKRAAILKVCFAERGDYRLDRMLSALP